VLLTGTNHFLCEVQTKKQAYLFWGVIFTLTGAILFSTKAVLAKLIYRESDISVVSLLTLRMLFSLPFYIIMLVQSYPVFRKSQLAKREGATGTARLLGLSFIIGLLGYYISSFLDFSGLKYISAGLERIILFSYPTFTVLFGALFYKMAIKSYQVLALLLSYAGVAIAFAGDLQQGHSVNLLLGSVLIFACAITYSLYVLLSGKMVPLLGVSFFTAVCMISATIGVFIHFLISEHNVNFLFHHSGQLYRQVVIMAVLATVVPSVFLSLGLKRIGSNNVAIISSIGPIATIIQAYWMLGEKFGVLQIIGTLLVVAGVLIIGRKARQEKPVIASVTE
jgi:drug/metabolite transporter (DMT)-like permease